ncbi:hypothetical protein CLAFUW4_13675 [Fulvia fulva]|uniref:PLC-like phosphodiesterase n=1 Tax=Passalora fulva TaxID=5499 RepID=A0A9Q8PL40_PASFU|nr:uncharacterized protein CLAFUR5_13524 [Fulvia fulva]KAK4610224.1 hypothetical protein CLAFUR4_13678 [Fulvia fulva]KAK4611224.1 hypothetical protein CLAFUR0_13682 [Fulvia fulva]UJO24397.1 hypothetical protein CLAFUR5_13524 [Fulvia fulva]WPV21985.1 hypothetical protein CLAFUW4_13675 [Fulvia fulva]WPV37172.1 hypothetical protein CLAFUW7_13683 [Fulvia fulva]
MLPTALWLLCLAVATRAQDTSSTTSGSSTSSSGSRSSTRSNAFSFTNAISTISGPIPTEAFTGSEYTYLSATGQSTVQTLTETTSLNGSLTTLTTTSSASSNSQVTVSSKSVSLTQIVGATQNSTLNSTASSTSSAAAPTNTVPCNGYPEFCTRKYSNITQVAAHNAFFVVNNNAASNQDLPITTQMNDGVRMLTGEVHRVNGTLYNCHTDCDLLNAGTYESGLNTVREWLQDHPYDVMSLLIVNSNFVWVENFTAPFENAGLMPYVYTPAFIPQYRDQWPTLGEMILRNERLVVFMDYNANQESVPFILDEFTHMWETPFSPQDQAFPCTQQRPPDLNQTEARENYMYLANHNLNTAIDLSSIGIDTSELLVPNTAEINATNGQQNEFGRLGAMNINCTAEWGRPPNWFLVDYYNYGSPEPGSVFEVAASANGVAYTAQCCGLAKSAAPYVRASSAGLVVAIGMGMLMGW